MPQLRRATRDNENLSGRALTLRLLHTGLAGALLAVFVLAGCAGSPVQEVPSAPAVTALPATVAPATMPPATARPLTVAPAAPAPSLTRTSPATLTPVAVPTPSPVVLPPMPARQWSEEDSGLLADDAADPSAGGRGSIDERRVFSVPRPAEAGYHQIEAVLRYSGEHIEMWVQSGQQLSDAALAASGRAFDARIFPVVAEMTGIDRSDPSRYYIVLNMQAPGVAGYYAAGPHAADSDGRPMLLVMNIGAVQPGTEAYESVLTHELQHVMHSEVDPNESGWVSEGASQLAETLAGYPAPQHAVNAYARDPGVQLNTWSVNSIVSRHYGASFLLLSYFYEIYGMPGLQALLSHPDESLAAFDAVLDELDGSHFDLLYADWLVANLLDAPELLDGRGGHERVDLDVMPQRRLPSLPAAVEASIPPYAAKYISIDEPQPGARAQGLALRLAGQETTRIVPTDIPSGPSMWWSNRGDAGHSWLQRTLDLTDVTSAALTFDLWFDIEPGWDYAGVRASPDGGESWVWLAGEHTVSLSAENPAPGPVYTGRSGAAQPASGDARATAQWVRERIDLSPFAGSEILLRFDMITDDAVTEPGLCVDNLAVEAIGWRDDDESGDDGWTAAGFVRIENSVPVSYAVQAAVYGSDGIAVHRFDGVNGQGEWFVPYSDGEVERVVVIVSALERYSTETIPFALYIEPAAP